MFISIIIPTYNRADYVGITLDSFLNQSYPKEDYEIIVCDNHSTDHTREVIKRYELSGRVRYLYEGKQGVHYARNKAAKEARGDILYFTDDDMLADYNCLKELISVFESNEKIGCAGGVVRPKWETKPPKWVERYCQNTLLSLIDMGSETRVSDKDPGVFSCHEAIRREAFFATGGFHPENTAGVWIGDGETGLNQDMIRCGWKFAYVGTSVIYHMIPPKRMTQKYLNSRFRNIAAMMVYSEYREKPFTKKEFRRKVLSGIWDCLKNCRRHCSDAVRGIRTIRFVPATICYYIAYMKYASRIVHDDEWRKFVLKNNWL